MNIDLDFLINNIEIGILQFDNSLEIKENNISKKCREILDLKLLENEKINEVLFENSDYKAQFDDIFINIKNLDELDTINIYSSLLPKKISYNNKVLALDFKIFKPNEYFVFIKDITNEEKIKKEIEEQKNLDNLIISLITNKLDFITIKNEFKNFLKNYNSSKLIKDYKILLTTINSYKGLFLQFGLKDIANAISQLENELKAKDDVSNEELLQILKNHDLEKVFDYELSKITKFLGNDILDTAKDDYKTKRLSLVETKLKRLIETQDTNIEDLKFLLNEISVINGVNIYDKINLYANQAIKNSIFSDKKFATPIIKGNKEIFLPIKYTNFLNSLIHVYKNCVNHGIEPFLERFKKNKKQDGEITTIFSFKDNELIIEISDDGKGIDIEEIKNLAIQRNILNKKILNEKTKDKILYLILEENFSTKQNSDILSSEEIGLNIVKNELAKLNGKVFIESTKDIGTKFLFKIPIKNSFIEKNSEDDIKNSFNQVFENSIINYIHNYLEININEVSNDLFDYEDYYSIVDLSNDENKIFCILSCDKKLIKELTKVYIQSEIADESSDEIYASIIDETLNTIIGFVISASNCKYKNLDLSVPLALDKELIETISNNKEKYTSQIKTSHGDLNFMIIYT